MNNCCKSKTESDYESAECFICKDLVGENEHTFCTRCGIVVHFKCGRENDKDRGYCLCPNCKKVGTMGCSKEVHIYHG